MRMCVEKRTLFAFGAASAGALALWWLWQRRSETPLDLSAFQRPVARVSKLWLYPVKSCKGVELTSAQLGVRGLKYDRSWVIVDKNGCFMTQRQHPKMALINPRVEARQTPGGGEEVTLHLSAPEMPDLTLKTPPPSAPTEQIRVWRTFGEAVDMGREVALWLEEYLGEEGFRLFYMSPHHKPRELLADGEWRDVCREGEVSGFSDLSPVLMISEASLERLNSHLDTHLPMQRFRPNVVISDCQPHQEDEWKELRIGDTLLRNIKPCHRCKVTTVNHEMGEFGGQEPLETLRKSDFTVFC
jgi:uncharacterized protein YcbX